MKKKSFATNLVLTFMVLALCFASLFFVSCGSDADGGGEATVVVTLKNVRITGTAKVGETLTATASDTSGATGESVTGVTYQWLSSDTEDGEYSAIENATERTYVLTDSDKDKYIKVKATKNGSEESDPKGPVDYPKLSSVTISGTAKVGETLTASAKDTDESPITAGITYSWLISDSVNGTYTAISEATASTYQITLANAGKYIKVSAIKEGITQTSSPTNAVSVTTIKTVTITGNAKVGETLTTVVTDTDDSTTNEDVTYQWQSSSSVASGYSNIDGATSETYTPTASYADQYIRVVVSLNGSQKESSPTDKVYIVRIKNVSISGTAKVGETLTADVTDTDNVTGENLSGVTYQWLSSDTEDGEYSEIENETERTYVLTDSDKDKYIKVRVTKNGDKESAPKGPVDYPKLSSVTISGTAKVGETLTASAKDTDGSTITAGITYSWLISDSVNGTYTEISGATGSTYSITLANAGKYIKVSAEKEGIAQTSSPTDAVSVTTIKTVTITGNAKVGETLTAVVTDTEDSTTNEDVEYQWQSSSDVAIGYSNIAGETSETYTLEASDADKYIRVVVSLNGSQKESSPTNPVYIVRIKEVNIVGTAKVGETLTAVATDTDDVTGENLSGVTYQWYVSDNLTESLSETSAITGATAKTYQIPVTYVSKYLAVKATKNDGSKTYWTTLIANGTLSDSYVIKNGANNIDTTPIVVTLANGSATLPELTVEGLKDATSEADVTGGTATFAQPNLTASKTLTITVVAPGYNSLTKDVFVTVKAAAPASSSIPALVSDDTVRAGISAGFTKFNITDASVYSNLEMSVDGGSTWQSVTAEQFAVRSTTSDNTTTYTPIKIRTKAVGTAGQENYIKESESVDISVTADNIGTKPAAHVEVTLSGDISLTESDVTGGKKFTAPTGYASYKWYVDGELVSGANTNEYEFITANPGTYVVSVWAGSYSASATVRVTN